MQYSALPSKLLSIPDAERPAIRAALVDMMVRYFTPIEAKYPRR